MYFNSKNTIVFFSEGKKLLTELMRCPMDQFATMQILDIDPRDYCFLRDASFLEACVIDQEIMASCVQFHNFWNMFECKLLLKFGGRVDLSRSNIAGVLDDLAGELEAVERAGNLYLTALPLIVKEFFRTIFSTGEGIGNIFAVSAVEQEIASYQISVEFDNLFEKVVKLFSLPYEGIWLHGSVVTSSLSIESVALSARPGCYTELTRWQTNVLADSQIVGHQSLLLSCKGNLSIKNCQYIIEIILIVKMANGRIV